MGYIWGCEWRPAHLNAYTDRKLKHLPLHIISYVILTSGGSAFGPLVAGYIGEASKDTWRAFQWFSASLAAFNFVVVFLAFPETSYRRPTADYEADVRLDVPVEMEVDIGAETKVDIEHEEQIHGHQHHAHVAPAVPSDSRTHYTVSNPSFRQIWFAIPSSNPDVRFLRSMMAPVAFTVNPIVLWGIYLYGIHLGAQIIVM